MYELAAAAAVLAVSADANAHEELEQPSSSEVLQCDCTQEHPNESFEADKENTGGDAARAQPEDGDSKVMNAQIRSCLAPCTQPASRSDGTRRLPVRQLSEHVMQQTAEGDLQPWRRRALHQRAPRERQEGVFALWQARGYDPVKPEITKAKLGYALDQYEATAYVVANRLKLPLLSPIEAKYIGKRIENIVGKSGTVGAKLKQLRKRGKGKAHEVAALLQVPCKLNLEPPPGERTTGAAAAAAAAASATAATTRCHSCHQICQTGTRAGAGSADSGDGTGLRVRLRRGGGIAQPRQLGGDTLRSRRPGVRAVPVRSRGGGAHDAPVQAHTAASLACVPSSQDPRYVSRSAGQGCARIGEQ